jgi:hypothetical protein
MATPIDIDNAMKLVSDAFVPCGCVAGANPEDDSFGFTVMAANGQALLNIARVERTQYADPIRLAGVIQQARMDLEHKGCVLQPWEMPFIIDPTGIPETPPNY